MEAPEHGDVLGIAMEGSEQQQPRRGGAPGADCVPRTGEQQGEVQGAGRGEVLVTEGQLGEIQGVQQQETREVHGGDKQQQRKEEGPMTEKAHARAHVKGAVPWVEGQQANREEEQGQDRRDIPRADALQQLLATEREQCGVNKGQKSRINELIRDAGIEREQHSNMNEKEFQEPWMEDPTVGPGIEAEQEGKNWIRDQEKEHKMTTGTQWAYLMTSDNLSEVKQLEDTIEEMLMRLDEFCGMADMIRNETTQLLDQDIHAIKAKVEDMNKVYTKVDKLEAFVRMVGCQVTFLEEQLVQAERDHQPLTHVVQKLLQSASIPSFLYKHTTKQQPYELPELFRTEDYIPLGYVATQFRKT